MSVASVSNRARPAALDVTVTTLSFPGLGRPEDMFVLADGIARTVKASRLASRNQLT